MSEPAFGATVTRLFDPSKDTHLTMSEDAQLELRYLFAAFETIATVMDTPPGQEAAEIQPEHVAPIFFTFARHGQRILADMKPCIPAQRKSA